MKTNKLAILALLGVFILAGCNGEKTSKNSNSSPMNNSSSSQIQSSNNNSTSDKTTTSNSSTSSYVDTTSSTGNSLVPMPDPEQSIYLVGAAVWGWSSYAQLTLMTDNVFYGTFDLKTTTEGFVMTSQTDFNGLVFKTASDSNFTVTKYGTYKVMFTYDDTKIDNTWTEAKEKNNAAVGYYKIELVSSIEIPIDEEMMYICGPTLAGWGTYLPLFLDEDTGIYSYIYELTNNNQGFIITNAEDNTHYVYHNEDGSNMKVLYSGEYKVMFTYNDMSADSSWTLIKEQGNNADGYYKLEPQFEIPGQDDKPNTSNKLYIFGEATGSWQSPVELPEVTTGLYQAKINITNSVEGFVVCELSILADKSGFCLHDEKGNNFQVTHSGLYELSITWNDMSNDSTWKVAKEVNSNAKGNAYYKLEPQFEIEDNKEDVVINELYLNGGNVGGWSSYVKLTKVTDTLFQSEVNLASSTDGFVVTAQMSRADTGVVLKNPNGKNLNIEKAGNYTVSISLDVQDDTWIEITDAKGNYKKSAYIKLEEVIDTRNNVILNGNTSATTSSNKDDTRTGDKVFDGEIGDTKRWESVQGVDPQWIEIDLGSTYDINGIDIQWHGAASAKTYTIEVSIDGEAWTTLKDVTNESTTRNRLDKYEFGETSVRYIRITGTSRVATYGYSIAEVYVWEA